MIKAIIFDLNGVFIKSDPLSQRLHDEYGVDIDKFLEVLKSVMTEVRKPGVEDSFKLWEPHFKELGLNFLIFGLVVNISFRNC